MDRVLGPHVLAADSPAFWQVETYVVHKERLHPATIFTTLRVNRPGMNMTIRVRRRVLTIHLLRDDYSLPVELRGIVQGLIIVVSTRRPGQMECPTVLHVRGEQIKSATGAQDLLNRLIVEQLTLRSATVLEDVVPPLVDRLFGVELVRDDDLRDPGSFTNILDIKDRLLALQVVFFADGGAIIEVVPSIAPKTSLDDVVSIELLLRGVLSGDPAEHAAVLVPSEYTFTELITG